MDLRALQYYVSSVECGSISAAADKHFVAQPSITSAVNKLEAEFDIQLLTRSRKGVEATRQGMDFYHRAKELLLHASSIEDHFSNQGERLEIKLWVSDSVRASHLEELARALMLGPHKVQLVICNTERDADILLKSKEPSDSRFIQLCEEAYALLMPNHHIAAHKSDLKLEDIDGSSLIERTQCEHIKLFNQAIQQFDLNLPIVAQVDSEERAQTLVAAGIGMTIAPVPLNFSHPKIKHFLVEGFVNIPVPQRQIGVTLSSELTEQKHQMIETLLREYSTQGVQRMKKIIVCLLFFGTVIGLPLTLDEEHKTLDEQARSNIEGTFIELSKGFVHYELSNPTATETVVLVHGFSAPSYLWEPTVKGLTAQGFRVLRFDLYGRGFSDRPDENHALSLFVGQIEELTNALNINEPFHLVGLSMGGPISTKFANQHPKQIKSLSLLAPLVETPQRLDLTLLQTPILGEWLSYVVMMPKIKNDIDVSLYDPTSFPNWFEEWEKHAVFEGYRSALLSTARHLAGKSFIANYRKLAEQSFPVQLIWGENDKVVPLSQSDLIRNEAPQIELHTIARCGHLPQMEHPDTVNRLLLNFISKPD